MSSTALHALIRRGNIDEVQQFTQSLENKRAVVNEVNAEGWNAARVAVAFDRALILQHLLRDCGAEEAPPRQKDGWTSLHIACFHGYDTCVHVLLDAGMTSTRAERDEDGRWPIHCAVQRDNILCLEHLLTARCDQNTLTSVTGRTALHVAASYGAIDCLERLLHTERSRLALRMKTTHRRSVVMEASLSDSVAAPSCLETLLRHCRNIAAPVATVVSLNEMCVEAFLATIEGTKVQQAVEFLKSDVFFELLLCYPIRVNSKFVEDVNGQYDLTPLHKVILSWNVDLIVAAIHSWRYKSNIDRRARMRSALLTDFTSRHNTTSTMCSPMALVFSTLNKKIHPLVNALFGTRNSTKGTFLECLVSPLFDPSVELRTLELSCCAFDASGDHFIRLANPDLCLRDSIGATEGVHVSCFVMRLAGRDAMRQSEKQRAFWKDFACAILHCILLMPSVLLTANKGQDSPSLSRATMSEESMASDAASAKLFRSYLGARVRQLRHFVAENRPLPPTTNES